MSHTLRAFSSILHVIEEVLRKSIVSESDWSPCQVDDDGCEDESGEEHDGLEAAVPEEGARHAEHQVEAAYRRWKMEADLESPHPNQYAWCHTVTLMV